MLNSVINFCSQTRPTQLLGLWIPKNGCMMTSKQALRLAVAKSEEDKRKSERLEVERIWRELKQAQRNTKTACRKCAFNKARDELRGIICGLSLDAYRSGLRSLKRSPFEKRNHRL